MKHTVAGIVLGLIFLPPASDGKMAAARVDVTVARSEMCTTGGMDVLRIRLDLMARGSGDRAVILSRLMDIDHFDLAGSEKRLSLGLFDQSRDVTPVPMLGRNAWATETPKAEFFQVIPPGESVPLGRRQILIIVGKSGTPRGSLRQGLYYCRVRLDPWRESMELGKFLAFKWKRIGELQLRRIFAAPFKIEIDQVRNTGECKGPPLLIPLNN